MIRHDFPFGRGRERRAVFAGQTQMNGPWRERFDRVSVDICQQGRPEEACLRTRSVPRGFGRVQRLGPDRLPFPARARDRGVQP